MMNRASLICQLLLPAFILSINAADIFAQNTSGKRGRRAVITAKSRPVHVGYPDRAESVSSIEKQVFQLINYERAKRGLGSLIWNDRAAKAARLHSKNMAEQNFFSHRGRDGSMVSDRANRFGVRWESIGENIVYFRGFSEPARFAAHTWMDSSEHKKNILNKRWQETGIGAIVAPDGTYFLTQVFILH